MGKPPGKRLPDDPRNCIGRLNDVLQVGGSRLIQNSRIQENMWAHTRLQTTLGDEIHLSGKQLSKLAFHCGELDQTDPGSRCCI